MANNTDLPPLNPETLNKITGFVDQLKTTAEEYDHAHKALLEEIKDMPENRINEMIEKAFNNLNDYGELGGFLAKIVDSLNEYRAGVKDAQKPSEVLRAIGVDKYLIPNNKVSNLLPKNTFNPDITEVIVSGAGMKNQVTTKVMLSYDEVKIVGRQEFTPFDRVVHNAVVSLYEAGNITFTAAMVCRTMNGLTATEYISPQSIESVVKSLDKSRFMRVYIDYTDEAKMYNQSTEKAVFDGYLLAANKITVKSGGETIEGYHLLTKPALYDYAQTSKQIVAVPVKLLNTKKAVNSTEEVIVIREYLIRQIEWMKSKKSKRSHSITYQEIWDELGITDITGQAFHDKTLKLRRNIKALLSAWVSDNYIKGFEEYKEKTTIKGVTVKP